MGKQKPVKKYVPVAVYWNQYHGPQMIWAPQSDAAYSAMWNKPKPVKKVRK